MAFARCRPACPGVCARWLQFWLPPGVCESFVLARCLARRIRHTFPLSASVVVVLVAADPQLEGVALVPAFRRPVEDWVVAHQELDPARPGRVSLVDGPALQDEHAEAEILGQVPDD